MAASNAADGIRFATDPSLLPKINPPKEDPHLKGLDLRQYTDFSINNEDLHDTWRPPYNRRLKEDSPGHHSKTLYDAWKRVQIPYLESNDFGDSFEAMSSDTRNAYEQQHNALCELRHNFQSHGELFVYPRSDDSNEGPDISHDEGTATPSKEAIHHFAYRIISQVQQQEKAVLGNFDGGKWWIAPPNASIELTSVETSNPTPDKAQPDGEGDGLTRLRESDRARAVAADYTVHWVCYQHKQKGTENSHLAVIIRERATGNTWYFDSLDPRKVDTEVDLDEKYQSVVSRLHKLCRKNDIEIPANTFHRRVGVIPQDRPWACGLHAIAHTLAFLRFGVLGWHEISTWAKPAGDEAKLRKLRHDMMRAMELSMGLRPTPRVDAEGIPFPEHYDDQLDLSRFRFPTYPSVGVEKKDLHNCEEPPFTDELEPSQEDILREKYGRVHIECYDGISLQGKGVDPFSYKFKSKQVQIWGQQERKTKIGG
ncbi:hypothetical protein N0V85_005165 [Neurospora sp. IMI 360204]|nr:hypothetical protein N0V85_005165 [Neurospora sp. IMI 360204]